MNEWIIEWRNEWMNDEDGEEAYNDCIRRLPGRTIDEWMNEWMNEWIDEWMNERLGDWVNEWVYVCRANWVYVISYRMIVFVDCQSCLVVTVGLVTIPRCWPHVCSVGWQTGNVFPVGGKWSKIKLYLVLIWCGSITP